MNSSADIGPAPEPQARRGLPLLLLAGGIALAAALLGAVLMSNRGEVLDADLSWRGGCTKSGDTILFPLRLKATVDGTARIKAIATVEHTTADGEVTRFGKETHTLKVTGTEPYPRDFTIKVKVDRDQIDDVDLKQDCYLSMDAPGF